MFTISGGTRQASYGVMTVEETRRSQRPYRYGLILLCCGALINWLGLTENYGLSIRYLGVSCIVCGAILICSAMCCWLNTPQNGTTEDDENENSIHIISGLTPTFEKPPAYETVIIEPPSYDDAIKLNPALLMSRHSEELEEVRCSSVPEQCNNPVAEQCSTAPDLSSPAQQASSSLSNVKSDESQSTLR